MLLNKHAMLLLNGPLGWTQIASKSSYVTLTVCDVSWLTSSHWQQV